MNVDLTRKDALEVIKVCGELKKAAAILATLDVAVIQGKKYTLVPNNLAYQLIDGLESWSNVVGELLVATTMPEDELQATP